MFQGFLESPTCNALDRRMGKVGSWCAGRRPPMPAALGQALLAPVFYLPVPGSSDLYFNIDFVPFAKSISGWQQMWRSNDETKHKSVCENLSWAGVVLLSVKSWNPVACEVTGSWT